MRLLPLSRCFSLKRGLLRWAGATVGKDVRCVSSALFALNGPLSIGSDTWIGHDVLVTGGNARIDIGTKCDIAPRVTFVTGTHEIDVYGERVAGRGYSLPISVGRGCWIGTGATILGGTVIGECSVVAAGAVVRGTFPSNCLIGGVPARVVRSFVEAN